MSPDTLSNNEDEMIIIELPIYYTFTKKTKKDNKVLVGMNWYRNAHFRNSNQGFNPYSNGSSFFIRKKRGV